MSFHAGLPCFLAAVVGLAGCSHGAAASDDSGSPSGADSGGGVGSGTLRILEHDAGAALDSGLFDPTEVSRVAGWLSNPDSGLAGYAYTNIDQYFPEGAARDRLVNSIVGACAAFAPHMAGWQTYCEALEVSEIVAESSYVPGNATPGPPSSASVSYDSYATRDGANDPTVGLLQVRFSSTVHDYNYYAPIATIEAIGCDWPSALTNQADETSFWTTNGGTVTYLKLMEDPACNIPLATWNVWLSATGNGGANPVYTANYCDGDGIAGNIVDGLLSYLEGPGFSRPADPTNSYPAGIKVSFAKLLGGLPSPDPFGVTLSPEVSEYCR